jgi:DNA-binding CsgD family transcriptional regulator
VCALLDTLDQDGGDCSVSLHIRLTDASGAEEQLSCILTTLAGPPSKLFLLIRDPGMTPDRGVDRVAQLEQHLWRIAGEVQASGILTTMEGLPDLQRFPQIGTLSTRQWEVLSRLLRGERVPTIAQELVVSQSTVRNYLSAIFEKFDVHSQAELLALLTKPDRSSR